MDNLRNRKIVLGVSGGIAAYKSPDLVRRLTERGAEVRVVLTPAADALVSATVFQAVSGNSVRTSLWDREAEAAMGHIELARWADLLVIAPATANLMASLATGRADNLLTTICLATEAPVFLAPAMNHVMWRNPATQANRTLLESRDVHFIGPVEGDQACGETGPGRMVEPVQIVQRLSDEPAVSDRSLLAGASVVITAGPTREPIDPVRFVSNRSSGKMGFAIARAAARTGAAVTLITGPVNQPTPPGVTRIDIETAAEMYAATMEHLESCDIFVAAAAVADYRPGVVQPRKIKKTADRMALEMVKVQDILAAVAALPGGPFTVGFAAETEQLEHYARTKLVSKNLDMIIANLVGPDRGFEQDSNSALVIWQDGQLLLDEMPKTGLAHELVELIAARYIAARKAPTPLRHPTAS